MEPQQKCNRNMGQNEMFLLVETTTVADGNVETTIVICNNELDWSGENVA